MSNTCCQACQPRLMVLLLRCTSSGVVHHIALLTGARPVRDVRYLPELTSELKP